MLVDVRTMINEWSDSYIIEPTIHFLEVVLVNYALRH